MNKSLIMFLLSVITLSAQSADEEARKKVFDLVATGIDNQHGELERSLSKITDMGKDAVTLSGDLFAGSISSMKDDEDVSMLLIYLRDAGPLSQRCLEAVKVASETRSKGTREIARYVLVYQDRELNNAILPKDKP